MEILGTVEDIRSAVKAARDEGKSVGFVPTMGALHAGHMSIVEQARADCGFVVVSIFVNPTQFGQGEDFQKYPRDIQRDSDLCREAGVDVIFAPTVEEMYLSGFNTHVDTDTVTNILEGASRPGHFRGVATVVLKLLNIVQPDKVYFGVKDYQQLLVVRKMVRDLNVNVEVAGMPTVREPDGLAMSSRNAYLNPQERKAATVLYRMLEDARKKIVAGHIDTAQVRAEMEAILAEEPLAELDYIAIADPDTLEPIAEISGVVLVALAVRIGSTRLIDNLVVSAL